MSRLREKYNQEIIPALKSRFGYKNVMQIPKLEKIVINMGVGEATADAKAVMRRLMIDQIAGQKPVVTRAKKSIAAFKVRTGMPVGCKVTLRGERMYEFMDKLINLALPRIRDFAGFLRKPLTVVVTTLWDQGAIDLPEINYDKVDKIAGWTL